MSHHSDGVVQSHHSDWVVQFGRLVKAKGFIIKTFPNGKTLLHYDLGYYFWNISVKSWPKHLLWYKLINPTVNILHYDLG